MSHKARFVHLTILNLAVLAAPAAPLGTTFTYQGQLQQSNSPVTGLYDFRFSLWDGALGGSLIGATQAVNGVPVSGGVFTVPLDFGPAAFNGEARWLEIALRTSAGAGTFAPLAPRQALTATPYALQAVSAAQVAATNLIGILSDGQIPTNVSRLDYNQVFTGSNLFTGPNVMTNANNQFAGRFTGLFTGAFAGDGSGLTNLPIASGSSNQAMSWTPLFAAGPVSAAANNGYLAGGASRVTLTLPASPAVGDVIRVAGAGVGGWRILQGASDQIILTQPMGCAAGFDWTSNGPLAVWRGLAASADGTKVVAVARLGVTATSTDSGGTWTPRNNGGDWDAVACSADGTKVVAGGVSGGIFTSGNSGIDWTPHAVGIANLTAFASSADGNKLVAATHGGYIYTSTDAGTSWTPHAAVRDWSGVACSADGVRVVAVAHGTLIYTSVDSGVSYTQHGPSKYWAGVASSADGSRLVAIDSGESGSGGQIYVSADSGLSWVARGPVKAWAGVASSADGSRLFAVENGMGGANTGEIYLSTDYGSGWSAHGPQQGWRCVATSTSGGRAVAAAAWPHDAGPPEDALGPIYTSSGTTTVGPAGGLIGGLDEAVELLYMGNNQFRVLSHEGTISAF